jgi:hypothetical protein
MHYPNIYRRRTAFRQRQLEKKRALSSKRFIYPILTIKNVISKVHHKNKGHKEYKKLPIINIKTHEIRPR